MEEETAIEDVEVRPGASSSSMRPRPKLSFVSYKGYTLAEPKTSVSASTAADTYRKCAIFSPASEEEDDVSTVAGRNRSISSLKAASNVTISAKSRHVPIAKTKSSATPSVAFDLPAEVDPDIQSTQEDDGGDNSDEPSLSKGDYRALMELIFKYFPEARSDKMISGPKAFHHEHLFSNKKKPPPKDRPSILLKINTRLSQVREDVTKAAKTMKFRTRFFPKRRNLNRVPGDIGLEGPPKVNDEFLMLTNIAEAEKLLASVPFEDLEKMENALQALQESQSFSAWLVSTLFYVLSDEGYVPKDAPLFDKIVQSLCIHDVEQSKLVHWLAVACVSLRKERLLERMVPSVSEKQKRWLYASSPFSAYIFDEEMVQKIKDDLKETTSFDYQLSVSKMVTVTFDDPKASTSSQNTVAKPHTSHPVAARTARRRSPRGTSYALSRISRRRGSSSSTSAYSRGDRVVKRPRSNSRGRSPSTPKKGRGQKGTGFH